MCTRKLAGKKVKKVDEIQIFFGSVVQLENVQQRTRNFKKFDT